MIRPQRSARRVTPAKLVLSTKPGNIEAPDCHAQRDKGAEEAVGGLYKIRLA
jgi:hypothetical protein